MCKEVDGFQKFSQKSSKSMRVLFQERDAESMAGAMRKQYEMRGKKSKGWALQLHTRFKSCFCHLQVCGLSWRVSAGFSIQHILQDSVLLFQK